MTNLIAYNNDGLSIYIDKMTGETFASISSYAKMGKISPQAVRARLKGGKFEVLETSEILTNGGLQGGKLITERTIARWIVRDDADLAEQLILLGIRKLMHTLAGYSQPQPEVAPRQNTKGLPSEYDIKMKGIRDRKNGLTKQISELQIQIDALKKQWESLDAEEDTLVIEHHKDIADEVNPRRAKVEKRKVRTQQEIDDIYEKAFGGKGK